VSDLITEEALKEWTGHKHRDNLIRWLDHNQVFWRTGKDGRICITVSALDDQQKEEVLSFGENTQRS
jgi:hypothetical protein